MLINEQLEKLNMTKYSLSKTSSVPQATINDICSGKADLEKCSAGTLYKIARVLGITIEAILDSAKSELRSSFEVFKSNTCHHVKDLGDLKFIESLLLSDEIRILYNKHWYPEALYLLAMLDYLSRENDIPICTKYNDIRNQKLERPIYHYDDITLFDLDKDPLVVSYPPVHTTLLLTAPVPPESINRRCSQTCSAANGES